MPFDRLRRTTGVLHKIKFYCVYGKIFFLLSQFLVAEDHELSQSTSNLLSYPFPLTVWNTSDFYLGLSLVFYINRLPDDVLCKIAI